MASTKERYRREGDVSLIEIGLRSIQQLFNSFDPSPFHEKDLDSDAEEYIVGAAREFPLHTPLKLVFYLPADQINAALGANLAQSIHNYFEYRWDTAARELRFLFQIGRTSLAIGITFLFACLTLRQLVHATTAPPFDYVIAESLLIAGWVAMWRPFQTFLYDWWPLRRMGRIYAKLSVMPVEIRCESAALSNQADGAPAQVFSRQRARSAPG